MKRTTDHTGANRFRRWWLSPPRSGTELLIAPYEFQHLRAFGITRIAGGSVAGAAGVICLSYRVYGWGAFFLALGALNLAGGYWYLSIDRSSSSRA